MELVRVRSLQLKVALWNTNQGSGVLLGHFAACHHQNLRDRERLGDMGVASFLCKAQYQNQRQCQTPNLQKRQ